ncbi:MAG: 2,3,4,5-tetrahydropyridine-2,6-dicarboxylate N-succinyltransferase [Pyrinomonadaceae bacterium]|nr:2,3,4,5-tetrahydropyridine-2,6-dicarboxylate N-succinyltransferase [Pyrinomonadaceae bacterium]MCX7640169.1 2,3,4,5-tetrahydropyridine-2,6-dicarboxylate N-succinyltransferase [Pyrinomonadaceae bacterium]MDW8303243.1 2,3,4,5-tetrahydropyridine-2,6-dicarboxylate N-succinyltransferase [Acidobacteriota bacterium]
MDFKEKIEELKQKKEFTQTDKIFFDEFRKALREGKIRAAEKDDKGQWITNAWVKEGILLGFRMGQIVKMSKDTETLTFFDKQTYPLRPIKLEDKIRIVPGGTSVRDGAYVAPNVVLMPPCYINVGAYVDEGTMIDSHALVGSCAQIGKRVHISAAAQIGGVLEPVNANPVIVEDDCLIGGNAGIYEGVIIRRGAVIASGVILTRSTPIFDLVKGVIYKSSDWHPLEVPEKAVVVQGARAVLNEFGRSHGLSIYAPIIVKYRDEKTDAATMLEDYLR